MRRPLIPRYSWRVVVTTGATTSVFAGGCLALPEVPDDLAKGLIAAPPAYQSVYEARSEAASATGWLEEFNDDRLSQIVEEALQFNYGLLRAAAVREQAFASSRLALSDAFPRIDGLVRYERDDDTVADEETLLFEIGASWELDLWGRVKAGVLSEELTSLSAAYDYEFARLSLAAAVANAWYNAVAARKIVEINRDKVKSEATTAEAARIRANAGVDTPLDEDFARANLSFARDELLAGR